MRIQIRFFILIMLFFSLPHLKADQYTPVKPSGSESVGAYHALIIGINKYKNHSTKFGLQENSEGSLVCNGVFSDLEESVRAAQEIKNILVGVYRFEANNIKMLIGEEGTETPTRNNIMKYFAEFFTRLRNTDSLLVFFSWHGCFEPQLGVGYWIASDGLKISGEEIRSIYKSPAKHVFIVSDSCYSAKIFPDVTSWHTESNLERIRQNEKLKSRQVLASGREKVSADSKFWRAFIDSMKENPDRMIDAQSIINKVKQKLAPKDKRNDQPEPVGGTVALDEGGQFVFRRKYSKSEEEIAQAYERIHENYKQLKIDTDALKELSHLVDVTPQPDSPVIEYYRRKSKKLLENIKRVGYLKKEYAERMAGIDELNTAKQMETLDSLLAFVDDNSDINIKQNDEIKEIIEKINDDKEMLLTYVRAYKKWDYKSFIEKYENKSPSRFSDALVKKAHEALEPMKMGHWFLGLKNTLITTNLDISYMHNEYQNLSSLSLGYFIEGKMIKIIPFIEIGKSSYFFTEDEFGTVNEFTLSARFKPFLTLSAGIDVPINCSGNTFLYFSAGHTFYFLKPDSFWEKNMGPLKFNKYNKTIGLSTIDIGWGINMASSDIQAKKKKKSIWKSIQDRLTGTFFIYWSTPIKNRIEYRIEIDEKYWVLYRVAINRQHMI
jgi:hypothetical protein